MGRFLPSLCCELAGRWLQQHTWIARAMSFEIVFNTLREIEVYIYPPPATERAALGGTKWEGGTAGPSGLRRQFQPFWGELGAPSTFPTVLSVLFLIPSLLPVKTLQLSIP